MWISRKKFESKIEEIGIYKNELKRLNGIQNARKTFIVHAKGGIFDIKASRAYAGDNGNLEFRDDSYGDIVAVFSCGDWDKFYAEGSMENRFPQQPAEKPRK